MRFNPIDKRSLDFILTDVHVDSICPFLDVRDFAALLHEGCDQSLCLLNFLTLMMLVSFHDFGNYLVNGHVDAPVTASFLKLQLLNFFPKTLLSQAPNYGLSIQPENTMLELLLDEFRSTLLGL